jgi:ribonuclease T2
MMKKFLMTFLIRFCMALLFVLLSLVSTGVLPAHASVPMTGQFTATKACAAVQSIRTQANPGRVRLRPKTTYSIIAKNNEPPSHYLVRVERANPVERWVAVGCGRLTDAPLPVPNPPGGPQAGQDYLLAISWQPSFCETKPDKEECQSQTGDRYDATHLALHGLWPQSGDYCNVSPAVRKLDLDKRWDELPPIALSDSTRQALAIKMPGYASSLHLHEWYKHGTCYSATAEEYFQESLALLDQINASPVRQLFADNIGQDLAAIAIRQAFDQSFGPQAGNKVQVQCKRDIDQDRKNMIVELQINLRGAIEPTTAMATLLKQGKNAPAGCPMGQVDPAGFAR